MPRTSADLLLDELIITIEGSYEPAEPDVGISAGYGDIYVTGLALDVRKMVRTPMGLKQKTTRVDLLAGLDPKAAAQVCSNAQDALDQDLAQEALSEAGAE